LIEQPAYEPVAQDTKRLPGAVPEGRGGVLKTSLREAIAREWLKLGSPAARAWVRQTSLPPVRQEKLLPENLRLRT
jgi:hypothetical protein